VSTLSEPTGDVTVQVRVSRLLGERRYAICLARPSRDAWVLDLEEARRLQKDLAEALAAAEDMAEEQGGRRRLRVARPGGGVS
jgi:hypothetical protein